MHDYRTLIAETRKKQGLTQSELAAKLGVTSMAVSKWERGLSTPSGEHLEKLVNLFGLEVENEKQGQIDGDIDRINRNGFLSTVRREFLRIPSAGVMLGICICRLFGTVSSDAATVCIGLCGAAFCLGTLLKAVR